MSINSTRIIVSSTGYTVDTRFEAGAFVRSQDEITLKDLPDDNETGFVCADNDTVVDGSKSDADDEADNRGTAFSWPPVVILFFFTLLEFLIFYDRGGLAAGLKQITNTLDINQAQGGVLGGAYLFGYCATAPVFAYVANFAPPLKLAAWGMLVWVIAVLLGGLSRSYSPLLICRTITGIGESSFLSIASTIIDEIAPQEKRSLWLALFYSAVPVGYAVGEAIGGIIVDISWSFFHKDESWRMIFVVEALVGFVVVTSFCFVKGPKNILCLDPKEAVVDTDTMWTKVKILSGNCTYLLLVMAYAAQTFTVGGVSYYTIEYFQDVFDLTAKDAGAIFGGVTVIAGFLGTSIGGAVLDRVKQKNDNCDHMIQLSLAAIRITITFMVLTIGPGLLFPFIKDLTLVVVLVAWVLLFIFMTLGPINNAILWCVELKDRTFAMALSVFFVHTLGDAAAPVILGALVDNSGWSWAMFIGMCPCVLCTVFLFLAYVSAKRVVNQTVGEHGVSLLA